MVARIRVQGILEPKDAVYVTSIEGICLENVQELNTSRTFVARGHAQLEGSRVRVRFIFRTVHSALDEHCGHRKRHASGL